ncbi:hypothetical protein LMG28727_05631 [Paraburkholderia kirstenboschensis]|uniref:hypothetical protein n=1 Tax=Paraburkholderia kirstenboschensis TaxID=1245436 RepID=UPI000A979F26|nr:hypothetical protein [Paraburkholderia kirstenboschensis]CAD6554027.1 hypothetical protein LMG28727_05631 [Paraburkholderia kirstenboschensis]
MNQAEYEGAIDRLIAAAELVVSGASKEQRLDALGMLAFFRLRRTRIGEQGLPQISDEDLFRETATAALAMAGRKELLAASALLDQARMLVEG